MWFSNYVLPVLIAAAVMLLVLWPTTSSGNRLLRAWGVQGPRPDQVAKAVRYLWQRRILYIVFFLAVPPLAGLVPPNGIDLPNLAIVVPLVVAMLIAELLATLVPVSGVRAASLDPRGWRDLVPLWSVAAMAVLVAVVVWRSTFGVSTVSWLALGYAAAALVLTSLLVWLAVRRPAVDDAAVDAALRTRTARVAVGIGLGWLGSAVAVADHIGLTGAVAQVAAFLCWFLVANPTRRSLAAVRR